MRVLVATPVYPHPGNAVEGLFNEAHAQALRRAGVSLEVLLLKPRIPAGLAARVPRYAPLAILPRRYTRNGIEVHVGRHLHVPGHRLAGLTIASCAGAIRAHVARRGPFDLLQVHSVWPVGFAAGRSGLPTVVTVHIEDPPSLWGSPGRRERYRDLSRKAALVGVGTPVRRFMEGLLGAGAAGGIRIIPNGIDHGQIARLAAEDRPPSQGRRIVSVSNLWRVKGIDTLLDALGRLRTRGDATWELVVVGAGPEESPLRRQAAELGLAERVTFAGRLEHDEALREILRGDIFCLPSRAETFGMVYLEAMACGKPVVGCRGTGAEDLVIDGVTGRLVDRDDPEGLSAALGGLLGDPVRARALGAAGAERSRLFSWDRTAAAYLELYRSMTGSEAG
jgi:glycosyltransferase involved in cell wall biosynthesis